MNILFVCHRFPYPPNRGGKIRPFHMIRHLSKRHHVVVATLAHSQEELHEGLDLVDHCSEVVAEVIPSPERWLKAALALPTGSPSSARYFWSIRLNRRIQELPTRINIDAVIVHCAFVADYVKSFPASFRMLDFGDLDSWKWSDYARRRPFPWSAGYALDAFKLRRMEQRLARSFDYCTVTAHGEQESYEELGVSTPCSVIPNGVDTDYFHATPNGSGDSSTIVFLGRMDYFPNVAGIHDFAQKVFPLIRQRIPQACLRIVGSNPAPKIRELEKISGISVTGFVSDVRPHVRDAAVAVAPLPIARGTQNKVLECMSMGIPVVVSPAVAKGVQATPGTHLLVGHSQEQFADHVVTLISNRAARDTIAQAGRRQVVSAHSWAASMQLLDQALDANDANGALRNVRYAAARAPVRSTP